SGEYRDSYTIRGRRGERLVADLRSTDMDPYLIVIGPDGKQEENDDHEGDQHRSMVSMELPADGEYRVLATTYAPRTTGSYELRIRRGGSESAAAASRRESGALRAGDRTLKSGEYVDYYTVQAIPGQRLRVDMSSSAFDTYLIVKDPSDQQTENDDAEGQQGHSIVDMTTTEAGTYTILATSYKKEETGAYQLTIDLGAAGSAPRRDVPAAALALGGSVRGRLEASDRTLANSGEYSDTYLVEGRPGQTLVVEMESSDFDTYVLVRTPDGESFDNDDDNGSSDRSRLEVPMRAAGRYRVVATSYRSGETGAYTLSASAGGASSSRPGVGTTVARPATPAGGARMGTGRGGRVYGVFVGISDYGGRASDLSFTARDATTMRDAMVRGTGMRVEDAVVLTDRQATVANVRSAIAATAARVGPNDTFVFFHSGHGGRVAVRGPDDDDPDGMDETISMFDADIRDDELGTMLDGVRSGLAMVVIDACFSGGFSKDVINKPGRVGFFSSEEDVVSAVAQKFRAGGFLPVFFAEAVGDHRGDVENAELNPGADRQLTLLELSQYLRNRYGTEVKGDLAGPGGGVSRRELNYQHLVVDRGGVDAYTVMFRW
ncbi:MAG TPA: pre-peptidase C-terminal domain-containing protein, partial [Longimicrobium sp.]|nr:pre-peptidase C-terminal domain-containing protein [Longimicrobium sp.]